MSVVVRLARVGFCVGWSVLAVGVAQAQLNEQCMLEQMRRADDATTVADLKRACEGKVPTAVVAAQVADDSVVAERIKLEKSALANPYAITPHLQNYILLASYSQHRPSSDLFSDTDAQSGRPSKAEAKFQISYKVPLARDIGGLPLDWYAAYTGRSFWQVYNTNWSTPFRETNHEPESWLQYRTDQKVLGMNLRSVWLGINHQSNGRGGDYSRSWNRVMGNFIFDKDQFALSLRPWFRLAENAADDDNPDIEKYMGNFEALLVYKAHNGNTFDIMLRDNLRFNENRGALRLGWSFPLLSHLRGYAQWFYGYGESLIDYNVKQNAIGIGLQLTDW